MKIKTKSIIPVVSFFCLLFISCDYLFSGLSNTVYKHFDEMLVVIMLAYILLNYNRLKEKRSLICLWAAFLLCGAVGTIVFGYQSFVVSLMDMILIISKFMIGYLGTYVYAKKLKYNLSNSLFALSKFLIVILFLLTVHDMFFNPFFPKGDYRYFMYSIRLFFYHPTYLGAASITLLIYMAYMSKSKHTLIYMILISCVGFFTLRSKTIGFILIFWLLYYYLFALKRNNYKFLICCSVPIVAYVGADQFRANFLLTTNYSPRLIMMKDSFSLAMQSLPIGRGFATYGSPLAAQYYSPLYRSLGYENYWGMSSEYSSFLNDSFWPIIIAQFGFIGLILFIFVIWFLIKTALDVFKNNRFAGFAMMATIINMLINSMAESSFFNMASLLLFMLFAVYEVEGAKS